MKIRLGSLLTLHCGDVAVGHTFLSLNQAMCGQEIQTSVVVPSCDSNIRHANVVEAIPRGLRKICYRIPSAPKFLSEARFLMDIERYDAVYLFPDSSPKLLKAIAKKKVPIFGERINCHTGKARNILDEAYDRLGIAPRHGISSKTIELENEHASFFDFIFCPSPAVATSFEEAGIPRAKLILASYGWSPERFSPKICLRSHASSEPIVVLSVGYLSVRKGTHLLLRAWEKADINGKLVLCGDMETVIAETCQRILERPDVVWNQYNSDIGAAYAAADVFAFPSLEEGSPLVTYEAMAHGLAVLVSPMAAGGVVRNDIDGIVIPPYDEDGWITALQRLAESRDVRKSLGASAQIRAEEFTWAKVGQRRAAAITERMASPPDFKPRTSRLLASTYMGLEHPST
jgi:glycosyltransferase involved in cell wall biosynthesis